LNDILTTTEVLQYLDFSLDFLLLDRLEDLNNTWRRRRRKRRRRKSSMWDIGWSKSNLSYVFGGKEEIVVGD